MSVDITVDMVPQIINEAKQAAYHAADQYFQTELGGRDQLACGFAWVSIYGIRGNTKLGRALAQHGIRKSYDGSHQLWDPSGYRCQNVDTLEKGARAAAQVFRKYGFDAYAASRLD